MYYIVLTTKTETQQSRNTTTAVWSTHQIVGQRF